VSAAIAAAHALVLSVSHFIPSLFCAASAASLKAAPARNARRQTQEHHHGP
jgi:hypothetical protein